MVDIRKEFPRKYMSAGDIDGRLTAQITAVETIAFRNGESALMLTLRHSTPAPKMVRCNQTNRGALMGAFGYETEDWIGKKIELWVEPTSMGPGIRMRPVEERAAPEESPHPAIPPKRAPKSSDTSRIEDDEIPWLKKDTE